MGKYLLVIFTVLAVQANAVSVSPQGDFNKKVDAELFQHKCSSCHSAGLIATSHEILPSEVWCLVNRMARTQGANIYCYDHKYRIYTYIVNFISRSRPDELEKALLCLSQSRRESEESALEEAVGLYQ